MTTALKSIFPLFLYNDRSVSRQIFELLIQRVIKHAVTILKSMIKESKRSYLNVCQSEKYRDHCIPPIFQNTLKQCTNKSGINNSILFKTIIQEKQPVCFADAYLRSFQNSSILKAPIPTFDDDHMLAICMIKSFLVSWWSMMFLLLMSGGASSSAVLGIR